MKTTLEKIEFNYAKEDKLLFKNDQDKHWENIETYYKKLRSLINPKLTLSEGGNHKNWIGERVRMHYSQSIIRLLYLTESFRNSALEFNSVASAVHIKAMVEIPLHLGYLLWIVSENDNFNKIREELDKLAFGNRENGVGLTTTPRISHKILYTKSDEMIKKIFKDENQTINIFETLYKESNATGHHNYEARNLLIGVQNDKEWVIKDRKEWFIFLSSNIFQFFLFCNTSLGMSFVLIDAIEHYLDQMPEKLKS